MKVYSYYFKSESGDMAHIATDVDYEDAIDFMMHEVPGEYDGWKELGYEDGQIPYCDYDKAEYEVG